MCSFLTKLQDGRSDLEICQRNVKGKVLFANVFSFSEAAVLKLRFCR